MFKTSPYICEMAISIPIRFKPIWALTYISVGITCILIFVLGLFVIHNLIFLVYILASLFPIYFGIKMLKTPYAIVSKTNIQVYGLFGELKHDYTLDEKEIFITKNNRIYIKNENKNSKLKINKWFVNQHDWLRVIKFFD